MYNPVEHCKTSEYMHSLRVDLSTHLQSDGCIIHNSASYCVACRASCSLSQFATGVQTIRLGHILLSHSILQQGCTYHNSITS